MELQDLSSVLSAFDVHLCSLNYTWIVSYVGYYYSIKHEAFFGETLFWISHITSRQHKSIIPRNKKLEIRWKNDALWAGIGIEISYLLVPRTAPVLNGVSMRLHFATFFLIKRMARTSWPWCDSLSSEPAREF